MLFVPLDADVRLLINRLVIDWVAIPERDKCPRWMTGWISPSRSSWYVQTDERVIMAVTSSFATPFLIVSRHGEGGGRSSDISHALVGHESPEKKRSYVVHETLECGGGSTVGMYTSKRAISKQGFTRAR